MLISPTLAWHAAMTSFIETTATVPLGTTWYMSPEQAAFRDNWAGPASDIYSLGVVLYELLCGRLPFHVNEFKELLTADSGTCARAAAFAQ